MNGNYSLTIDDSVLHKALFYAEAKGVNLSSIIESFLSRWTREQTVKEKINNFPISQKVKSLAGRMKTDGNSLDWDVQKEMYFKEKYGL